MAARIGMSASLFSKKASGIGLWTDEEKGKLTRIYGKDSPKSAYDPRLTIDRQAAEITGLKAEINQYHRGTKIAWVGVAVIGMVCATIIFYAYKPVIWDYVAHKAAYDQIMEEKVKSRDQRIATLTIALDAAIAVDGKWDAIFGVQEKKIKDIEGKMKEVK
jgi:hypothetical protein